MFKFTVAMDAKDRRIAELEAKVAALEAENFSQSLRELEKKVKQLEKRPVLEADVLASRTASPRSR